MILLLYCTINTMKNKRSAGATFVTINTFFHGLTEALKHQCTNTCSAFLNVRRHFYYSLSLVQEMEKFLAMIV
jgi:hypothetical protein